MPPKMPLDWLKAEINLVLLGNGGIGKKSFINWLTQRNKLLGEYVLDFISSFKKKQVLSSLLSGEGDLLKEIERDSLDLHLLEKTPPMKYITPDGVEVFPLMFDTNHGRVQFNVGLVNAKQAVRDRLHHIFCFCLLVSHSHMRRSSINFCSPFFYFAFLFSCPHL